MIRASIKRRAHWFVCLGLLSGAVATASPILDYDRDVTAQFTESLPLLNWIGPDLWPKETPFDLDDLFSACPLSSPKVLECFLKFFFENHPPVGDGWFFGNDPVLPAPQGSDPDPVTPEPATWKLLAIGLAGVAVFRHRAQNRITANAGTPSAILSPGNSSAFPPCRRVWTAAKFKRSSRPQLR
jgi:hypothetical protein